MCEGADGSDETCLGKIDIDHALNLSASAACRTIIEKEAAVFVKWHNKKKQQKLCQVVLSGETRVTNIFKHFEVCPCETNDKLGEKLTAKILGDGGLRLPYEREINTPPKKEKQ